MFELEFTPTIIVLLSAIVLTSLYLLLGFRHYVASVSSKVNEDNNTPSLSDDTQYPSVSVIVYSEDDATNLEILLPQILEQDYNGRFEVIVVNDGAMSSTKDVIARMEQRYSNLYMTFTPLDSRSLSRKKLAITLGIKAARYDIVILTSGNCRIESKTWLKAMIRHFIQGKEIVIGYATPRISENARNPHKRLHAFDEIRTAIEYLSWAIAGRPYRGLCHNLAYRRDVFFKNKGFSRSLHLRYGDDDIFINEVANHNNTAVELSTASIVEVLEDQPQSMHANNKLRYDFTAKSLRTGARLFFGSCSFVWWLFHCLLIATSFVGLPSLLPAISAGIIWLIVNITIMIVWRRTSRALGSRSLFLTTPWFITFEPIYNLYYRIKGFSKRKLNYSWAN